MATETTTYKFQKPDLDEFYDVGVQNKNWDAADTALKKMDTDKADKDGGDVSKTTVSITEPAGTDNKYPDKEAKDITGAILGKLWRWVESLKTDKAEGNHNHDTVYVKSSGGDISNTKIASVTASTDSYPVPVAGDTGKVFMGKVAKFFGDIRNATTGACFIGQIVNNCVSTDTNKPLSAAQGKYLMDLYTGLNTKTSNVVGTGLGVGQIFAYNDTSRAVGISHKSFDDAFRSIPIIIYDGTQWQLIPANLGTPNATITNIQIDYNSRPWALIIEAIIDGTLYIKRINMDA